MTTETRKKQVREAKKRNWLKKKDEGRNGFYYLIKPEWRKELMEFCQKLEKRG